MILNVVGFFRRDDFRVDVNALWPIWMANRARERFGWAFVNAF